MHSSLWSKPALKPTFTTEHDAVKEKKHGAEDEQLNGAHIQPHSAFSSDSKTCNTNPHFNALNLDGDQRRDDTLEAAVLKEE